MEHVFITIHDLSLDARIKYVSDSVEDILGYLPHEVRGRSCWEYFHPDEIPFARAIHGRGINLDKAAVLSYCQIKHKDGSWIGCECVFTIVYDVLVASTSLYRRGPRSRQRALDAPGIRRIFSSSPRDPRYHMLSYISNKFYQEPRPYAHEPRAALFLNRFTRSSTIMFATDGIANILGIPADQLIGKSFYYCISANCLSDAVHCLESAKANDSIAYLRFWYRDPLHDDDRIARDSSMPDIFSDEEDNDDGGVQIKQESPPDTRAASAEASSAPIPLQNDIPHLPSSLDESNSRSSSGNSTDLDGNAADAIFDRPAIDCSTSSSTTLGSEYQSPPIEVEAVVSCSSDGLVVVLRRARPFVPTVLGENDTHQFANGLFASPWAPIPVMPDQPQHVPSPKVASPSGTEPEPASFMSAIREVAVFAWSLTGINGTLADYGRGKPVGEALPPGGLPVWDPKANVDEATNNVFNGFSGGSHRPIADDEKSQEELTSSDDEIVYKRAPEMPPWRRPPRRAHADAFGPEADANHSDSRASDRRRRKIGSIDDHP